VLIRPEGQDDHAAVRALNVSAFEASAEADLVFRLRREADPVVSLVAEHDGIVVGHIMFSPVTLSNHPGFRIMGLAPMAVAPEHQRQGIGTALVQIGLARCEQLGIGAVVVLGHPDYYPRFGFKPGLSYGMTCEYDAPTEAFMVVNSSQTTSQGLRGRSPIMQRSKTPNHRAGADRPPAALVRSLVAKLLGARSTRTLRLHSDTSVGASNATP
jgi:putative acetyltransferase